jgi:hypothetical protein
MALMLKGAVSTSAESSIVNQRVDPIKIRPLFYLICGLLENFV